MPLQSQLIKLPTASHIPPFWFTHLLCQCQTLSLPLHNNNGCLLQSGHNWYIFTPSKQQISGSMLLLNHHHPVIPPSPAKLLIVDRYFIHSARPVSSTQDSGASLIISYISTTPLPKIYLIQITWGIFNHYQQMSAYAEAHERESERERGCELSIG